MYNKYRSQENSKPARKFSSAGRASALQAEGHRFEPCNFHHQALTKVSAFSFSFSFSLEAPIGWGTRCVSNTPFPGREFFAEPHRGVALCGAQETCADAARAHKRGGHQGFHPSYESPRFLLASAYQRTETIKERQRIFTTVGADQCVRPFLYLYAMPDSLLLHMRFSLRRRDTR